MLLLNIFPLAPFLSSDLWQTLGKFESGLNFKEIKYFGDLGTLLKKQHIVQPRELINVIRKEESYIKVSIFVIDSSL